MSLDDDRRFFFAHVQKTAGTSFIYRVRRQFTSAQMYPDDSDIAAVEGRDGQPPPFPRLAPSLLVSHLVERYRLRRHEIRFVSGHFPLRTVELLGDEFVTLTLLRDPVERTLSFLRHGRQKTPSDQDHSLEEMYDHPLRFEGMIHNNMVKMFSLSPEEMRAGHGLMTPVHSFTYERLEEAKRRLRQVDVVGFSNQLEAFCDELTDRFGWQLGPPVYANRTEPDEVADSFRARIEADNALDVELYQYALDLSVQRSR